MTLYALTTFIAAFVAAPHAMRHETAVSQAAPICAGQKHRAAGDVFSDCCDICDASAAPALEPPPVATFIVRQEIETRLSFAQRLGHVADASPDDLRSRAPPAFV